MKFTDLFIRRPVLAIVVSCLLLMLGLQGAGQLSVRQFPDVEKSLVSGEYRLRGRQRPHGAGFRDRTPAAAYRGGRRRRVHDVPQ